jgi:hypothetical protein
MAKASACDPPAGAPAADDPPCGAATEDTSGRAEDEACNEALFAIFSSQWTCLADGEQKQAMRIEIALTTHGRQRCLTKPSQIVRRG